MAGAKVSGLSLIYSLHGGDYIGSIRAGQEDERLRQHRAGECRTTKKMAVKYGVDLSAIEMEILYAYDTAITPNLEDEIMNEFKADGWGRWIHPNALSAEDARKGQATMKRLNKGFYNLEFQHACRRKGQATLRRLKKGPFYDVEMHRASARLGGLVGGLIGGHATQIKSQATLKRLKKGPFYDPKIHRIVSRLGGCAGGRIANHARWHVRRGIVKPTCTFCQIDPEKET